MKWNSEKNSGDEIRIAGVCERDVDLLLLEEFHAGDRFWRWLAGVALGEDLAAARFVRARHSVDQSSGESDLELAIEAPAGRRSRRGRPRRIRILIENKLDAAFQPQQAERYRTRGDAYFQNGEGDRWVTVLLAPRERNPFGLPFRLRRRSVATPVGTFTPERERSRQISLHEFPWFHDLNSLETGDGQ